MLDQKYFLKDKILLSKQLAWVSGVIGFIYAIISYVYFTPLTYVPLGALVVALIALWLHKQGHHNIARLLSGFDIAILIMIYQGFMVKAGDEPIAPLVLGANAFSLFPFLLFHYSERKYIIISVAIVTFGFLFQEHINVWLETSVDTSAHRESFLTYFTYIAATAVFMSGVLLAARNTYISDIESQQLMEEVQAQNEELRQQQEEIMSQRDILASKTNALEEASTRMNQSIKASKALQRTVIPSYDEINALFPDSWVYYKAKDVVSGDFYWAIDQGDVKIVVAADCTGHGVPGALMSMIGISLLDKLVQIYRITDPAELLEKLHVEIVRTLRQKDSKGENGMDLGITTIQEGNEGSFLVKFAGAKRPLHIWNTATQTLETIKPDRHSLGGNGKKTLDFSNKELELTAGSMLYMGSDGITDQSDVDRRKFGRKKLLGLLQELGPKSGIEQKKVFFQKMETHMIGSDQRDDMLLLGIRVGGFQGEKVPNTQSS